MKIVHMIIVSIVLCSSVVIAFAGIDTVTQPMQFTGGPEFSVERTTATMEFTGQ